mmetsp:Transcript_9232/g.25979  ORF Transcript_9232/g.25979 Transcript_9232/m.25979 type:complete len:122 (+) Transcript_9232:308-673(+)
MPAAAAGSNAKQPPSALGIKKGEEFANCVDFASGKGFWRGRGMDSKATTPPIGGIDTPVGSSYEYCFSLCSAGLDSSSSAGFRYYQRCLWSLEHANAAARTIENYQRELPRTVGTNVYNFT